MGRHDMSNLILTCTIQTQKFTRQITFNFQEPEISKEVLQKKKEIKINLWDNLAFQLLINQKQT
jgi:hypothetical protein